MQVNKNKRLFSKDGVAKDKTPKAGIKDKCLIQNHRAAKFVSFSLDEQILLMDDTGRLTFADHIQNLSTNLATHLVSVSFLFL